LQHNATREVFPYRFSLAINYFMIVLAVNAEDLGSLSPRNVIANVNGDITQIYSINLM